MLNLFPPVMFQPTGNAHEPLNSPADSRQGRPRRKPGSWDQHKRAGGIRARKTNRRSISPNHKVLTRDTLWYVPEPSHTWLKIISNKNMKPQSPTGTETAQTPNKHSPTLVCPQQTMGNRDALWIACSVHRELLFLLLFISTFLDAQLAEVSVSKRTHKTWPNVVTEQPSPSQNFLATSRISKHFRTLKAEVPHEAAPCWI